MDSWNDNGKMSDNDQETFKSSVKESDVIPSASGKLRQIINEGLEERGSGGVWLW